MKIPETRIVRLVTLIVVLLFVSPSCVSTSSLTESIPPVKSETEIRSSTDTATPINSPVATRIETKETTSPANNPITLKIEPTETITIEPTQPTPTPTQGFDFQSETLAFTSIRDGYKAIYILNLDNYEETRLVDLPNTNQLPAWSPDGSMMAFTYYSDIPFVTAMYVVDINTKQVLTQLENVFPYVWSNDGKRIIYAFGDKIFYETGWQDYSNTLYIMSAQDWTSQVLLDTEWSVWRLYWSPVEDKILAQVDDDGPDGSGAKSLYIIELNGTVRKLPVEVDYSTWSADGRKVIYSISKKLEGEIRQINIDGTQDEIVVKIPGSIVSEPKLSPSGEWLAYRSYKMLEPNAIFLLNNWNKELIQVSPNGVNSASYSWSSNGKYLAYLQSQKNQELGCSLHIFSLETLESVKIIENLVYCYDPVWQP